MIANVDTLRLYLQQMSRKHLFVWGRHSFWKSATLEERWEKLELWEKETVLISMDKLINTLCFHLIDISNGAILQLSRYYKLYLLWLKDVGNSLCARFSFESKWGRNWCFYWLRILWIEIIAFAMGIASCIGMVLFSSVLLGHFEEKQP